MYSCSQGWCALLPSYCTLGSVSCSDSVAAFVTKTISCHYPLRCPLAPLWHVPPSGSADISIWAWWSRVSSGCWAGGSGREWAVATALSGCAAGSGRAPLTEPSPVVSPALGPARSCARTVYPTSSSCHLPSLALHLRLCPPNLPASVSTLPLYPFIVFFGLNCWFLRFSVIFIVRSYSILFFQSSL